MTSFSYIISINLFEKLETILLDIQLTEKKARNFILLGKGQILNLAFHMRDILLILEK